MPRLLRRLLRLFSGKRFTVVTAILLVAMLAAPADAGRVRLKNGLVLEGTPVPIQGLTDKQIRQISGPINIYPILLVHTDLKKYFVPDDLVDGIDLQADLNPGETFKLPQKRAGRRMMFTTLGALSNVGEFDKFGRRTVTAQSIRGPVQVVQGVTKITPDALTVLGITHDWQFDLETSSVSPGALQAMIANVTDRSDPQDRMSVARFWIEAERYDFAGKELETIARDFPELKARVEQLDVQLRQLRAKQLLAEIRLRQRSGQHSLAYKAMKVFPLEKMGVEILREIRGVSKDYDDARDRAETVVARLGELHAMLDNDKRVASEPLRSLISRRLDYESLDRLGAFVKLEDDDTLAPERRLAVAYSGWILGSANASTDFDNVRRLWKARSLILEYLSDDDPNKRDRLLQEIESIEGVNPDAVLKMIPQLPPVLGTPRLKIGEAFTVDAPVGDAEHPVRYSVLLPQEYNPHHKYPMIIALRPAERDTSDDVRWWGGTAENPGQSQRRGAIVISPEYVASDASAYDYSAAAHYVVQSALRDARKRFSVDSDRVFLAGHGMGGDAAFDIGMSHPDLFAGVVPIAGMSRHYCKWYWKNCEHLAFYVVAGQLDRDSMGVNARECNRLMKYGWDMTYCEYSNRGYERFFGEIHSIFDWMDVHKRPKYLKEVEAVTLRAGDNRFFWFQADGLPESVTRAPVLAASQGSVPAPIRPMTLGVRVSPGNTIYITSGAERNTVWLSPEYVDFDKRVAVRWKGRQRFNDFVKPQLRTILEDLRIRGDREKTYQAVLSID